MLAGPLGPFGPTRAMLVHRNSPMSWQLLDIYKESPQLSEAPAHSHGAAWCSGRPFCAPVCAHCLLSRCWASLTWAWLHPLCPFLSTLSAGWCTASRVSIWSSSHENQFHKKARDQTQCPCPLCWTNWQLLQILGFAIYKLPVVLRATQLSPSGEMIPMMDRMQSWVLQHLRNPFMNKTFKFLVCRFLPFQLLPAVSDTYYFSQDRECFPTSQHSTTSK